MTDDKRPPLKVNKMSELEQEKIIFKELYKYLSIHEKFSKGVFDTMSHELRTPTVSIRSYSQMLLDGKFGTLTTLQKEKITIIKDSVNALIYSIYNLIDKKNKKDLETAILEKEINDEKLDV